MSESNINDNLKTILDDASNLSLNQIRRLLNKMTAPEIAHALESSPPQTKKPFIFIIKN